MKSIQEKRGYRQRMMKIWREKGMFNVSEQRLADQERAILKGNLHCYNKLTLSRWK